MRLAAALLALAVTVAGCAGSADATSPSPAASPDGAQLAIVADLCRARAASDDPRAAEATFFGDAHTPLHELADDVATVDRQAAARLLVAKNAVESAMAEDAPPAMLRHRLATLVAATSAALDTLGTPATGCGP